MADNKIIIGNKPVEKYMYGVMIKFSAHNDVILKTTTVHFETMFQIVSMLKKIGFVDEISQDVEQDQEINGKKCDVYSVHLSKIPQIMKD